MLARITQAVIVLQASSIWLAVAASVIEVESIVVSGAILSSIGLLLVVLCMVGGWRYGLMFALAVPSISIVCFSVIYGLSWSPDEASRPIPLLLFVFGLVAIPLARYALREVRARSPNAAGPLQFRLSGLVV